MWLGWASSRVGERERTSKSRLGVGSTFVVVVVVVVVVVNE